METHVYANDKEFCSQAADGVTVAFPDVCHSPPKPPKIEQMTGHVRTPATTVFVCGTPIAKKDASYLATSIGDEPATRAFKMGIASGTIKGKAYFVDWSPNVKIEGLNVDRHVDPMTHNHS